MRSLALVPVLLWLAACGGPPKVDTRVPPPPRTTLAPDPGPFSDRVTVTLTSDLPATVYVTTDGSDPAVEGPGRKSGPSPLGLELTATTTLRYYAVSTQDGLAETPGTAVYTRAGGAPGSISGEVVFATVAVGKKVAVSLDRETPVELGTPSAAGALPFRFENVSDGTHRLRAWADRDGNGTFAPVLDLLSDTVTVEIDSKDEFKASAEGVKLLLAASEEGLCTLTGTVTFNQPPVGQSLSIAALSFDSLSQGASNPAALLQQLQNGYQVFTNDTDTGYAYAITNLEPGSYVPLAILTGLGAGGAALNFQGRAVPLSCGAGDTQVRDFTFGRVTLSGSANYTPPADAPAFVYGVVAGKTLNANFTSPDVGSFQAVLMPTVFTPGAAAGTLTGGFGALALKENAPWSLRAFPSTDAQNPFVAALPWLLPSFVGGSNLP
ncbi:MAG: chitobiase/beta-hexosaminidase C-terminal domain-containing protein, partial [Deltaproteobacteria bacterium]|nr:chitobiase/beta-hexosaminidase C-terminal domain-containing protein [Deltaproteobacteria bacterium]